MDLKLLKDTPPWEWPKDAGKMFLEILNSDKADEGISSSSMMNWSMCCCQS
jgi:hypothetical protein